MVYITGPCASEDFFLLIFRDVTIVPIELTLQEVPLRYYYYCVLPLQFYFDTFV